MSILHTNPVRLFSPPSQFYLHNHLSFILYFHKEKLEEGEQHNYRVVRFEVVPQSVKVEGSRQHFSMHWYCMSESTWEPGLYSQIWWLCKKRRLAPCQTPATLLRWRLTPPRRMRSSSRILCTGRSVTVVSYLENRTHLFQVFRSDLPRQLTRSFFFFFFFTQLDLSLEHIMARKEHLVPLVTGLSCLCPT